VTKRRSTGRAHGMPISADSAAVQAHLAILQSVMQRMASNSANCKAWCVALVSAILVLVAEPGSSRPALLAAVPTVLFLLLDTYYLALERRFRDSYNRFIGVLHRNRIDLLDLYAVGPGPLGACAYIGALRSWSIWPFYVVLLLLVTAAGLVMA